MEGWAYGDKGEHAIIVLDSLDEALDHALSDNFYHPDDNTICAGYVAEILVDENGKQLDSDHLGKWFAEDVLVATGDATKKDFSWRYDGNF